MRFAVLCIAVSLSACASSPDATVELTRIEAEQRAKCAAIEGVSMSECMGYGPSTASYREAEWGVTATERANDLSFREEMALRRLRRQSP